VDGHQRLSLWNQAGISGASSRRPSRIAGRIDDPESERLLALSLGVDEADITSTVNH
jgi:hypothetical protein